MFYSLPKVTWNIGRQEVNQVAERRRNHIKKFLEQLFNLPDSIAHCDLVYTFFHPMLIDVEETNVHIKKLKNVQNPGPNVQGSLKVKIQYSRGSLLVMIQHAQNLPKPYDTEPNPFVKVTLQPDPVDETTRKTKVRNKTCFPSFVEPVRFLFFTND